VQNSCFLAYTTFLRKEGNSKNRTKIRSILQIYVQGARSRFHASGPGGTMIRPWWLYYSTSGPVGRGVARGGTRGACHGYFSNQSAIVFCKTFSP